MFIRATGARVTLRAQANAEVFSGNSERNGATHWMKTNWDMPKLGRERQHRGEEGLRHEEDHGAAAARGAAAPAAQRFPPENESAQRETAGISSSCSRVSSRGGIRRSTPR